jgi:UDP-4-amino-4-deoxy-L-arabinose-oxoglutarate aminotransferase
MRVEFYRHDLGEVELASLRETFSGPFLTLGPRTGVFEKRLATELGVPHVVGVSSCTMGLMLALRAFDVGEGHEVITTPLSWISSPNAALYVNATPIFADVDPRTGLIDPADVARRMTPRTKAIMCVHLYGQMCDVRALREIADRAGAVLIEDSAHGFESERDGLRPGVIGDAAVFSFYATKTITSGDGGAIALKSSEADTRLRRLRNHGVTKDAAARYGGLYQPWDMVELGYKAAMTDVEAALLLPQLDRAHARRAKRQAVVERYESRLRGVEGITLIDRVGTSAHHLFTVHVDPAIRGAVLRRLGEEQIGTAINYTPIHLTSYYRNRFGFTEGMFPHCEAIGASTLSLPLWPDLPSDQIDFVCDVLIAAVKGERS